MNINEDTSEAVSHTDPDTFYLVIILVGSSIKKQAHWLKEYQFNNALLQLVRLTME